MKISFGVASLFFLLLFSACEQKNVSASRALFWGFAMEGFPITKELLDEQKKKTMINPGLILFYLQWPSPSSKPASVKESLNSIWEIGALPCLSWEPMYYQEKSELIIPCEDILSGRYDHYLTFAAEEIKAWGKPLVIRFAHEMNISRYHWGVEKANYDKGYPSKYKKMFQYVVDFFRLKQVNNVLWAFCPNSDSIPGESWNSASNYYPGDRYVDILGMDGYNWDVTANIAAEKHLDWIKPWQSFEQIFHPLFLELIKLAPTKPVIVFETASVDRSGGQKSLWIRDALATAKKWGLTGIIWFEMKKEEDWNIEQNGDYSYLPFVLENTSSSQTWVEGVIKVE